MRKFAFAFVCSLAATSTAISVGCAHPGAATLTAAQCILDTGILATVEADLASANYEALIVAGITDLPALYKCALAAIAAGNGTGSAPATADASPIQRRAREMLAKYGAR